MTSTYSDLHDTKQTALKVTASSQEWCGHTYTHLAWKGTEYNVEQHSYFEGEGDRSLQLPAAVSENGIWTMIRYNPAALPTGSFDAIPGLIYQRYGHSDWKIERAVGQLENTPDGMSSYTISYPELERTLSISFAAAFPHEIESWEETRMSGFGDNRKQLTTKAAKNKRMKTDYWNRNRNSDAILRSQLGLE